MPTSPRRFLIVLATAVLGLAACTGDEAQSGDPTDATTGTVSTAETGETSTPAAARVSIETAEPGSLLTLDANESEGMAILAALYTPLVTYDPQTSEVADGMAADITTDDDGRTWTITLEDGWTFHDGEPVTADSFVDAWNAGATVTDGHLNAGQYVDIVGFEAMAADPPTAETLAGLTVVDDLTFTVELTSPSPSWPVRLGHVAFAPLPSAYFADPEEFGEAPVGNGPYEMVGAWQHDQQVVVARYDDWGGEPTPAVDEIEFRIYDTVATAVNDLLGGQLDIVPEVPPEMWPLVVEQLGDAGSATSPSSSVTFIGFPMQTETFGGADARDLRAALSMAIDREAIADVLLNGSKLPASDLLPPTLPGHRSSACPNWTHDAETAADLWQGSDAPSSLTIWFNSGTGQEEWIEAVANQWQQTLGIDEIVFESLQPADFGPKLMMGEIEMPFRAGWAMDYPHPAGILQPLLASSMLPEQGGANFLRYTSDGFDAALDEALAKPELAQALPDFQAAIDIACEDVPLAPVYFGRNLTAFSDGVASVHVDAFSTVDFVALEPAG